MYAGSDCVCGSVPARCHPEGHQQNPYPLYPASDYRYRSDTEHWCIPCGAALHRLLPVRSYRYRRCHEEIPFHAPITIREAFPVLFHIRRNVGKALVLLHQQ